jgi:hypothetical protein
MLTTEAAASIGLRSMCLLSQIFIVRSVF